MNSDEPDLQPLRARINTTPPHTGWFDGAWWPYGQNLTAELPSLLANLTTLIGTVHRVAYHPADWDPAPNEFETGGTWVRLSGFDRKPTRTLDVLGIAGARIGLVVIPPHTAPEIAHAALETAATLGDTSKIEELLRPHIDGTDTV